MNSNWLMALALVCLITVPGAWGDSAAPAVAEGREIPDFALRTLAGETRRISEYRGEVVLVNFWATWCSACRQQFTALEDLHEKYHGSGLTLLSVNIDDDAKAAAEMVKRLKLSFPVLMDARKDVAKLYELENLPFTVLVDREGTVRALYSGYKLGDERAYLQQVRTLLKE